MCSQLVLRPMNDTPNTDSQMGAEADLDDSAEASESAMAAFCIAAAVTPSTAMECGVAEVSKLLGRGIYSEVWQCRLNAQPDQVAVKIISSRSSAPNAEDARLLKDLIHPKLVQVVEVVERLPNLVILELCLGVTLDQFLHGFPGQAVATFGMEERLKPPLDVSCAVAYLHSKDIVHRDIKASNVFFAEPVSDSTRGLPMAKLGDLQLARQRTERELMTPCVGSVLYMAPEKATCGDYGKPADIFAVAVLLNELGTGERPYSDRFRLRGARDMVRVTLFVSEGGRPRLCDDERLHDLVRTCWNQDPAVRRDASALASCLQSFL